MYGKSSSYDMDPNANAQTQKDRNEMPHKAPKLKATRFVSKRASDEEIEDRKCVKCLVIPPSR